MTTISNLFKVNLKSQSIIGIASIILGCAAISAPFLSGIFFSMLLAISMCAVGIAGIVWLFKEEKTSTKIWMALLSITLIISSFFMYQLPGATLLFSSGILISFFLLEGTISVIYGIKERKNKGAGWTIFYGVLSVICAGLLIVDWPITGLFAIGTYVGIKLIFLGINMLSLTFVANAVVDEVEQEITDSVERSGKPENNHA